MKPSDAQFEQLTAYLDGELSAQERLEVEALIARDPGAASLLNSLRQVAESVAALPREAAPTDLPAAVQDRLARRALLGGQDSTRVDLPPLVMWMNRLAVAACLALVCTAGWLGMQRQRVMAPANRPNVNELVLNPPESTPQAPPSNEIDAASGTTTPADARLGMIGGASQPQPAAPTATMLAVAFKDAGEFERKLMKTGVSNFDLQAADLSSFSNRVVIDAENAEARDKIVKAVEKFATGNSIPDANAERLPEPVNVKQSFYMVGQSKSTPATEAGSEETWIGINAPPKVAAELMTCVNQVRATTKAQVQMEVNGCAVESPNIASQLVAMNAARNQRILSANEDSKQYDDLKNAPAPAAAAAPGAAVSRGTPKEAASDPVNKKSGWATRESDIETSKYGQPKESRGVLGGSGDDRSADEETDTQKTDANGEAPFEDKGSRDKEAELKRADEDDVEPKRQRARTVGPPGRATRKSSSAAVATEATARSEERERSAELKDDRTGAPLLLDENTTETVAAAAPPIDGCVTLSICVRSPVTQRASGPPPTTSQASDTLRPPAPTTQRQTSMPAAGAARD